MTLHPCSSCQRHIKAIETRCPFCGTSVTVVAPRAMPALKVAGRAAVVFATTAALSVTSCGKKDAPRPVDAHDADVSSSGTVVAVYGPPPQFDELHDATVAMPRDGGSG